VLGAKFASTRLMWAELIFSRDDLAKLLAEALPLTIHLAGDETDEHSLALSELTEVALVPDVGLRVVCKAHVRWPVLGVDVPIAVRSVTFLLLPTIGESPDGETLVFRASIEHADFAALPTVIDNGITSAINARLAAKGAELSWGFARALTYNAALPAMLDPLASFAIRPAWGKVRITDDAIVYAASFHSAVVRRGEAVPEALRAAVVASPPPLPPPPHGDDRLATRDGAAGTEALLVTAGAFALAAGAAFLLMRGALRARSTRYSS
jgi:hypothetical protein